MLALISTRAHTTLIGWHSRLRNSHSTTAELDVDWWLSGTCLSESFVIFVVCRLFFGIYVSLHISSLLSSKCSNNTLSSWIGSWLHRRKVVFLSIQAQCARVYDVVFLDIISLHNSFVVKRFAKDNWDRGPCGGANWEGGPLWLITFWVLL
jgi:hypothetical protein